MWEAIFLLVVLKIPIAFVLAVVWWAVRNEPQDDRPSEPARIEDTPIAPPAAPHPRPPKNRPRQGPARRPATALRRHAARGSVR